MERDEDEVGCCWGGAQLLCARGLGGVDGGSCVEAAVICNVGGMLTGGAAMGCDGVASVAGWGWLPFLLKRACRLAGQL